MSLVLPLILFSSCQLIINSPVAFLPLSTTIKPTKINNIISPVDMHKFFHLVVVGAVNRIKIQPARVSMKLWVMFD